MSSGFRLEGMEELLKRLNRLEHGAESIREEALQAGAEILQQTVISEVPQDDGTLKENIQISNVENGTIKVHTGKAHHAHLVEFGRDGGSGRFVKAGKKQKVIWGDTAPNAFMERSFNEKQEEIQQVMGNIVKRGLGI